MQTTLTHAAQIEWAICRWLLTLALFVLMFAPLILAIESEA
ncbi:MAG: hypothetical protein ACXW1C_05400 [Gallionella sp.]